MLAHCVKIHTISAFMLPRGYIFQYGFLGGSQFKKSPKTWTFSPKSGGLFKEKPQKLDFSHYLGLSIQEWGSINADTVDWSNFWKVLLYKKGGGEFQILGLILLKYVQRQGETRDSNYILTTGRTHTYDVDKFSTVLPPKKNKLIFQK